MANEEKGGPTKVKFGKNRKPVFADDNKLSKTEGNSDDDVASSSGKATPRVKFTVKKKTFPQVSFSTFEGMIEQGIPCPVELVREGDRELARKLLDEQLEEMKTFPITEEPKPTFKKRKSVHDRLADSKPALRPSPEREQANEKNSRWLFWLTLIVVAAACSLAYGMELGLILGSWGRTKPQPLPYQLLPIYTDFPTADRRCLPVTFEMYRNLKDSKSHEWDQMADSMQKHSDRGYPAFSAFRVGKPYCYMTIKTADNQTIAMVNPEVVGVNLDSSVMREEKSINCLGKSKHVNRYRDVWVRYQDPSSDFDVIERKISDKVGSDDVFSFIFQSEYNYLNGRSICDNTEKGAESLIEIMREGKTVIRPHHSASK